MAVQKLLTGLQPVFDGPRIKNFEGHPFSRPKYILCQGTKAILVLTNGVKFERSQGHQGKQVRAPRQWPSVPWVNFSTGG